jgi:hypothetical protein
MNAPANDPARLTSRILCWTAAAAALAALAAGSAPLLEAVHLASEVVVRALP